MLTMHLREHEMGHLWVQGLALEEKGCAWEPGEESPGESESAVRLSQLTGAMDVPSPA